MSKKLNKEEQKQRAIYCIIGVVCILAVALVLVFVPRLSNNLGSIRSVIGGNAVEEPVGRHPLTGFPIFKEVGLPRVFGVMIDNHNDARPQAGIDKAFLAIEAPVEAGIPRILAFFADDQDVEKIGPVRSARPYFIDWDNEFGALFAHVGGSDEALDEISSGGTFDLNQYWFSEYFWRSYDRYAPHNVYTSTKLLASYPSISKPLYETWSFKDTDFSSQPDTSEITLSFDVPDYIVKWVFDAQTRRYSRFQAGSKHAVEGGIQIAVDNIAVVISDVVVLDNIGHRRIRTIGEGDGFVFQDGKKIEAVWKKESESNRLRFYNKTGKEIQFNAGITWIEVVPSNAYLKVN